MGDHPTVVFDLGDVLVPSTGVLPALAAEIGVELERLTAAYWPGRLAYDLGGDDTAYWTGVLRALDVAPEPQLITRLTALDAAKWSALPAQSARLISGLDADGVRLGVLSNAPAPLAAAVRAAEWSRRIDVLVFSAEVGLAKPDPAIYAAADEAYGTAPQDVVFFDDRPANVEAARAHGWAAHVWEGPQTLAVLGRELRIS
ncbi:putative hydrolase of the HAD superfamily [Pseudonocardia thermophila]|jgi:haloacid dehalogenase superfamily, subfamily IA, variant 3 with third motif having DD or ED|uniref:Putative hydrolase of the HAD superfamily n=1 Tax=Pseudonocardia thermophila TaxID=1848 RepID=A0A1M6R9D1_PSETH|nr:HAD-IA family hydrolase [Pseudonocardia thermophila]SHK29062.1 putative hydrolase of the HAD superfamily [Pseudonocardia thermophila]